MSGLAFDYENHGFSSLIGWTNPFEKDAFLVKTGEHLNPNFRGENSKNVWVATTQ